MLYPLTISCIYHILNSNRRVYTLIATPVSGCGHRYTGQLMCMWPIKVISHNVARCSRCALKPPHRYGSHLSHASRTLPDGQNCLCYVRQECEHRASHIYIVRINSSIITHKRIHTNRRVYTFTFRRLGKIFELNTSHMHILGMKKITRPCSAFHATSI